MLAKSLSFLAGADAAAIVERGRQAARDLGADPVGKIDALVATVLGELDAVEDGLVAQVVTDAGKGQEGWFSHS